MKHRIQRPTANHTRITQAILAWVVLGALSMYFTSAARAQDAHYWTNQYGTRAQLLGGLVVGSFVDLSSTYYNPATMALVVDVSVLLTANTFQVVDIEFDDVLGQDFDLLQQRVRPAPSMFATDLPISGLGKHKLAISVLTRRNFAFEAGERGADSTGVGAGNVRVEAVETWAGPTWAYPLNETIGIGVTGYLSIRSQRNSFGLSVQSLDTAGAQSTNTVSEFQYWHLRAHAKLGLGVDLDPWIVGLTVTTRGLGLAGQGKVFSDRSFVSSDPSQGVVIEGDSQEDLSADFRSPFAVALGVSRQFGAFGIFATAEWFESVDPYSVLEPDPFTGQTSGDTISVVVQRAASSVFNWGVGVEIILGERSELYASFFTDNSSLQHVDDSIPVALASWDILNFSVGAAISVGKAEFTAGFTFGSGSDQVEQLVNLTGDDAIQRGVKYRSVGLLLGIGIEL